MIEVFGLLFPRLPRGFVEFSDSRARDMALFLREDGERENFQEMHTLSVGP